MMITNQKRLAAEIFSKREGRKVGVHRIWVDPSPQALDDVANAVQKEDVRRLIEEGIIKAKPLVVSSRAQKVVSNHPMEILGQQLKGSYFS